MAGPFTFWTFGERNFFANRWGEYLPLSADASAGARLLKQLMMCLEGPSSIWRAG